jgi:bifunctional non-homologous end joining protein LigD
MAFDLLAVDGEDLRGLPLLQRKRTLTRIMPRVESRLRYVDHVPERGCDLFRDGCERDLEGVVGNWARGRYWSDGRSTSWVKIKNPNYSQVEGRGTSCSSATATPLRQ